MYRFFTSLVLLTILFQLGVAGKVRGCAIGGKWRENGDIWVEDCNTCFCMEFSVLCTRKVCSPKLGCQVGELWYANEETWKEDCNRCLCHEGLDVCTRNKCLPKSIPCNKDGGEIKQYMSYPWFIDVPSQCTPSAHCACKDGFIGEECEHDCMRQLCPRILSPVCARTFDVGSHITYPNKCEYFDAKCRDKPKQLYFLYNGSCQDDSICRPIICPMDGPVTYIDDPNNPGCKRCV